MSKKPLSKMDHTKKALDMDYLKQPRGPGTGWVFYMVTPPELIGKPNPLTGKLCRKTLIKGLGTRHPVEARKRRDIALGEIRKAVAELSDEGRFSLSSAEEWREVIANDDSEEQGIELVLSDQLEKAAERGVPEAQLRSFNRVALGKGYPITTALDRYIEERSPGNRRNFKPLALTTVGNLKTAVGHLRSFLEDHQNIACMEDVTPNSARAFRDEYLPELKSPRSPLGMSHKTVSKNITLLTQFWAWAVERRITMARYKNPWIFQKSVPRASRSDKPKRSDFTPHEFSKLLQAVPSGTHKGDLIRLAIVTGCRADELATITLDHTEGDGSGFYLTHGKTSNALRYVPVPADARALLQRRVTLNDPSGRIFPEWPIRGSSGKAAAVSQWFTRFRRKVLGPETDHRLSLHSTRHTWRTVARRARVNEADINDLGGWSGPRSSSSAYDHGILKEQLEEAQQTIWEELKRSDYLEGF
ncbi:tyrosine-type recombinase/integrase [Antarctobacter sp.]|uniref:tyrosine-type recombinase/integrase n=1 Tax=Antarctobacter sp. TaxID=1872577 RepID=UPI003A9035A3